jgi:hypothetical protein
LLNPLRQPLHTPLQIDRFYHAIELVWRNHRNWLSTLPNQLAETSVGNCNCQPLGCCKVIGPVGPAVACALCTAFCTITGTILRAVDLSVTSLLTRPTQALNVFGNNPCSRQYAVCVSPLLLYALTCSFHCARLAP